MCERRGRICAELCEELGELLLWCLGQKWGTDTVGQIEYFNQRRVIFDRQKDQLAAAKAQAEAYKAKS